MFSSSTPHRSRLQITKRTAFFIMLYTGIFCLLGIVVDASMVYHIPVSNFLQDPASTMGAPFYTGFISNVGVLFWTATTAICFFNAYLYTLSHQNLELAQFFKWSGIITGMLLIDDFFMLHDAVLFILFHINENLVFLAYMGVICGYLFFFRKTLMSTNYKILFFALGLFVLSTLFDKVPGAVTTLGLPVSLNEDLVYFIEESGKLFAIVTWFVYYLQTTISNFQSNWRQEEHHYSTEQNT